MVRLLFQPFYVREKAKENETNNKETSEDNEQNKNESKSEKKPWSSLFTYLYTKERPKTADKAVGDDEIPKARFLYFFWFRKAKANDNVEKYVEQENARMDKLKNSFYKEALIVTRETVASTFASVFSVFISHPFNVIKSQYQLLRYPKTIHTPYLRRRKFIYVLRDIYMTKGLRRLYKNLFKAQHESLFEVVSMFWTFHRLHQFFEENFEIRNQDATNFLAGFFSATIPVLVIQPYETYRERHEIKRKILEKHGKPAAKSFFKQLKYWRPLHRGSLPMFLHMSVQYGLRFMIFHKIRNQLAQMKTTIDKATDMNPYVTEVDSIVNFTNFELLSAGALAAILGDILAHPLDVIRSRLDMKTLLRQQYRYDDTCRHFGQCVKLIFKNERPAAAFYAGITPCIIRSTVNTALQFALYEKMRDWLRPILTS